MTTKKKDAIAVLTSGGDAPGMNCAIRAVVRSAIGQGLDVYGIKRGFLGLVQGQIEKMSTSSVGNILQRGGTILFSSRCPEFKEPEVRAKAFEFLKEKNIKGLVVIGGDGSFKGAQALSKEHPIKVIGIPGTIDNDISGTDYTIGHDTGIETALHAVDRIRDTALAHDRTFFIEVMGARSSAIALKVGICSGAESIILNPLDVDYETLASTIQRGIKRGKRSSIVIVSEGEKPGLTYDITKKLFDEYGIDSKVCILGHIQRGGAPVSQDRFMASLMGAQAVHGFLHNDLSAQAVVCEKGKVFTRPLDDCMQKSDHVMKDYIGIAEKLSI